MHRRTVRVMMALAGVALLVAGCSTGTTTNDLSTTRAPDGEATSTTPTSAAPSTTDAPGESNGAPTLEDLWAERGYGRIVLNPPGDPDSPHPALSWQPVEGAASYWVVVKNSDGQPYWAWTGSESEVRFGGGDRTELNQTAALFEPMTWSVVAIDVDGLIMAFSDWLSIEP